MTLGSSELLAPRPYNPKMAQMYGKEKDTERDSVGKHGLNFTSRANTLKPCLRQWRSWIHFVLLQTANKSPSPGTLHLFLRTVCGDSFYTAYGPDTVFVTENVYHTNTVIKYLGAGGCIAGVTMCCPQSFGRPCSSSRRIEFKAVEVGYAVYLPDAR